MIKASCPSERQEALLDAEDWRHHAVDFIGTGLGFVASTEKVSLSVDRLISFSLPSAPALFLNLAGDAHRRRLDIDLNSEFSLHPPPQGTWPETHSRFFEFLQEMMAEIVLSFSAIEAFANEAIPIGHMYRYKQRDGAETDLTGLDLERKVSLDEKLSVVLPNAYQIPSPKGKKEWEKYRKLKAIRDRLVHLKSIDRKASGPENQTIWGSLIENRNENFAMNALSIIGAYPKLVGERRWYKLASAALVKSTSEL